jgi:hypothetical protein
MTPMFEFGIRRVTFLMPPLQPRYDDWKWGLPPVFSAGVAKSKYWELEMASTQYRMRGCWAGWTLEPVTVTMEYPAFDQLFARFAEGKVVEFYTIPGQQYPPGTMVNLQEVA